MKVKAQPLHDGVLIKPAFKALKTQSGIIVTQHNDGPQEGVVVAVGPGRWLPKGVFVAMPVKPGDRVIYERSGLKIYREEGTELHFIPSTEILAILHRPPEASKSLVDSSAFDMPRGNKDEEAARNEALKTMVVEYLTKSGMQRVGDMDKDVKVYVDKMTGENHPVVARGFIIERDGLNELYTPSGHTVAFGLLSVFGSPDADDAVIVRLGFLNTTNV